MSDNPPNGSPSDAPAGYPGAPTPPPPTTNVPYSQPSEPTYPQQQPQQQPPYGYPAPPSYNYAPAVKTNALALTSLISSIAAFVIVPFIGSVVGVITGHIALRQLKTSGENGRGMALAGTIVGWVGVALSIVGIALAVIWFTFLINTAANSGYNYYSS